MAVAIASEPMSEGRSSPSRSAVHPIVATGTSDSARTSPAKVRGIVTARRKVTRPPDASAPSAPSSAVVRIAASQASTASWEIPGSRRMYSGLM